MGSLISGITGFFGNIFSGVTSYIIAGLVVLLVALGVVGYLYFEHSQSQMQILAANVAKLTVANQEDQTTITAQANFAKSQATQITSLQQLEQQSQSAYNALEAKLRSENITQAGQSNAPALETQINSDAATLLNGITAATQIGVTTTTGAKQ
jgi:hypothetical protein